MQLIKSKYFIIKKSERINFSVHYCLYNKLKKRKYKLKHALYKNLKLISFIPCSKLCIFFYFFHRYVFFSIY